MSLASESNKSNNSAKLPQVLPLRTRRTWRAPRSSSRWLWLAGSAALYILCLLGYIYAVKTQASPGPADDPLRLFGITAFVMVLGTASYSLRRRFARGLPGKVQDWLWMHTWLGVVTILLASLHDNFTYLTHDFCQNVSCLTTLYGGPAALYALLLLVLSGIIGRLLDRWQTHVIAREASSNGVGIARALAERVQELEYTVERLCAGKSEPFKAYCMQTMEGEALATVPSVAVNEQTDLHSAVEHLTTRANLLHSLQRQQRARHIMRTWRTIHIVLACLALLIILYHGGMQLLSSVFHIIPGA